MLLAIHLFFLVCCTPFYLAIKEMPARAFVMYTDASIGTNNRSNIWLFLITHRQSSTVYYMLLTIYFMISYPPLKPSPIVFPRGLADWRLGCAQHNICEGRKERERERKKECVVLSLSYSMDVFPVGWPLFFQNSKEPLQNQQQQQTPVYSHSLPSLIVNSARELDRVLSRLEMLR